jgi:putative transcriptional regulator
MRASFVPAILLFALMASLSSTTPRRPQSNKSQGSEPQANKPPTSKSRPEKTAGQFLVAGRGLGDPFFQESVVLMLPIKEEPLLVGLIINKPLKIKVRDLFPDSSELKKVDAMAYFGGPVDARIGARSAIFRSKTPPDKATWVFGDVYVSFDPDAIAALAANPQQASALRVFVGRAQWDPEQLEGEVAAGAWHNWRGGADSIFTTLPEMLWRTLLERCEPRPVVQQVPGSLAPAGALAFINRVVGEMETP